MRLLAIDIGSSSVKAAVLVAGKAPQHFARQSFKTSYTVDAQGRARASVRLRDIESAVRAAIASLGAGVQKVDLIVPSTMAPSWLALDARGRALTDVVTHQDRRSVDVAQEIERRLGRSKHLRLAGNRPFPGGISSTTWAWHLAHERTRMRRAALVGHLGTWLGFALTGARVIDTSNAGFTGLLDVRKLAWSDELIDAVGVERSQLPRVVEANAIVGKVTAAASRRFGVPAGVPMLAGCIDGSAAMLATGAAVGQLVNVSGSTDVLALCTDRPRPSEHLLTRPLGVGNRWLSVGTLAAAGTAIEWARQTLYAELEPAAFYRHLKSLARRPQRTTAVRFDNHLAGSRTAMEVTTATFSGLSLSTTRDDLLWAIVNDLAHRSAERLERFKAIGLPTPGRDVFVTGGLSEGLPDVLRRYWPKRYRFRTEPEATARGLMELAKDGD